MKDHAVSRLTHVLRTYKDRLGSWSKLAGAIRIANEHRRDRRIDRRTLEKICDDDELETVRLNIGQLIALDRFFMASNEGSLLSRDDSLIDAVAESLDVNFMVAAKYVPGLNDEAIARWDLRAITRLLRTRLNQLQVRIWDVTGPANWKGGDPRIKHGANIAIGSPIANFASEVILSRMLGLEVGGEYPIERLPFSIVRAANDKHVKSIFVRSRTDAARIDAEATEELDPERRALIVGDQMFVSNDDESYALLVAQRDKESGQAQIVLCGLTGPGTYYLARILQGGGPAQSVPESRSEQHPPILLTAYKLMLEPDRRDLADGVQRRRVVGATPVHGPAVIHFVDEEWQFLQRNRDGT
jgi:hypothetical protein